MDIVLGVRYCPATRMTLCVTSDPEMDKCIKMKVINYIYYLIPFYKTSYYFNIIIDYRVNYSLLFINK